MYLTYFITNKELVMIHVTSSRIEFTITRKIIKIITRHQKYLLIYFILLYNRG